MAFDALILRLNVLLDEMKHEPEDLFEIFENLHQELKLLKVTGHELPQDLLQLEYRLEQELLRRREITDGGLSLAEETIGIFGFHFVTGQCVGTPGGARPEMAAVQLYVKSSQLSRSADLAISPKLVTEKQVKEFCDNAISALREIQRDAMEALQQSQREPQE